MSCHNMIPVGNEVVISVGDVEFKGVVKKIENGWILFEQSNCFVIINVASVNYIKSPKKEGDFAVSNGELRKSKEYNSGAKNKVSRSIREGISEPELEPNDDLIKNHKVNRKKLLGRIKSNFNNTNTTKYKGNYEYPGFKKRTEK